MRSRTETEETSPRIYPELILLTQANVQLRRIFWCRRVVNLIALNHTWGTKTRERNDALGIPEAHFVGIAKWKYQEQQRNSKNRVANDFLAGGNHGPEV